ncbi:MspA protein [Nocardia tenerifensis]|uniref:MspA protein n=1 Tax=Nocardia tenerifensis TaxID=228006 RepID=A0A318JXI7_9NOCA|nr:MspA family porin [Nocardia tenerifensis]PXX59743.1 MspA protein [Nocardia tenerifensis]
MSRYRNSLQAAGLGIAATVALGLCSATAARADTYVPLPGGEIVRTLSDGTVVTLRIVDESATISPSMGATPLHRNAWVSGRVVVEISGTGAQSGGFIYPGYSVGCQVNIAGGGAGAGAHGGLDWSDPEQVKPEAGAETSGNLSVGPGRVKSFFILDQESPDLFGEERHYRSHTFEGSGGSVTWSDTTIGLSGCAGYAQARAFAAVEVFTPTVSAWISVYGQPFSIG